MIGIIFFLLILNESFFCGLFTKCTLINLLSAVFETFSTGKKLIQFFEVANNTEGNQ